MILIMVEYMVYLQGISISSHLLEHVDCMNAIILSFSRMQLIQYWNSKLTTDSVQTRRGGKLLKGYVQQVVLKMMYAE